MTAERFRGAVRMAAGVLMVLACAATASAQTGQVRGKVQDAQGQPVADATITIDFKGNITRITTTKTDARGNYVQVGLPPGPYEITAAKGDLKQTFPARVNVGGSVEVNFALIPGANAAPSVDEAMAREARRKALNDKYVAAVGLIEAGQVDEAIAALNALITEAGSCAICQVRIGDALWKKGDEAGAEATYKAAAAADPKLPEAHAQLAALYNQQKKFDQANASSKKAAELGAASGGPVNASVSYNAGVIHWNSNSFEEAKAKFEEVIKADPKYAEAYFMLGRVLTNLGQLKEAVDAYDEYLKLAPSGPNAAEAKKNADQLRPYIK